MIYSTIFLEEQTIMNIIMLCCVARPLGCLHHPSISLLGVMITVDREIFTVKNFGVASVPVPVPELEYR